MRIVLAFPLILMGCSLLGGRGAPDISSRGSVCGQPLIRGEAIGPVLDGGGCGVQSAVRVHEIGGVRLSQPSVMECSTARVLNVWVQRDMDRIVGLMGGGVEELQIASHYACRSRNSQPGARISEHARGRAIDIAAFHLRDGDALSVEEDWGNGRRGRILRRLNESACGPFGTVLGPKSDRHHQDHFHFDTASHRSGAYCR
ncbi:MAG: extensin family protein [Roseovarius sp.]|nr:extensin family protein [Roseovarius sp.]